MRRKNNKSKLIKEVDKIYKIYQNTEMKEMKEVCDDYICSLLDNAPSKYDKLEMLDYWNRCKEGEYKV